MILCSFQCITLALLWLNLFLSISSFDVTIGGIFFLFSFSDYLLLLYRNTTWYLIIDLVPCNFAELINWFYSYFLYIRSCHLWIGIILLRLFQSGCLLFLFLALLSWLGPPAQCWIEAGKWQPQEESYLSFVPRMFTVGVLRMAFLRLLFLIVACFIMKGY